MHDDTNNQASDEQQPETVRAFTLTTTMMSPHVLYLYIFMTRTLWLLCIHMWLPQSNIPDNGVTSHEQPAASESTPDPQQDNNNTGRIVIILLLFTALLVLLRLLSPSSYSECGAESRLVTRLSIFLLILCAIKLHHPLLLLKGRKRLVWQTFPRAGSSRYDGPLCSWLVYIINH